MELYFAERLRKYRRERDLTQDELAQAIGISPQSVSKWERGDGYPDITLLPRIANYFGITIDTLLGNDENTREMDIRRALDAIREKGEGGDMDECLRLALRCIEEYPESDAAAHECAWVIWRLPEEKRAQYLSILREQCEKIIAESTTAVFRDAAVSIMCQAADDAEFPKWYRMCAHAYDAYEGEVLEKRLLTQKRWDECRVRNAVNRLHLVLHFLLRSSANWGNAEYSAKWNEYRIRIIESFETGGVLPQAWLGAYALHHLWLSSSLFGCGEREKGYAALERSLDLWEEWAAIPDDTWMELGEDWFFCGIRAGKNNYNVLLPEGIRSCDAEEGDDELESRREYSTYYHFFLDNRYLPHHAMTAKSGWEWFDCVRGEARFVNLVERARSLAES